MRILGKSQHAMFVHDSASRIHHAIAVGIQSGFLLFPVKQITAHRMPPAHVFPSGIKGILLKIQMVYPILVNQPVGIIHPPCIRRKMDERMGLRIFRNAVAQGHGIQKTSGYFPFYQKGFSLIFFHIYRRKIVEAVKTRLLVMHGNCKLKNLFIPAKHRYCLHFLFRTYRNQKIFSVNLNIPFHNLPPLPAIRTPHLHICHVL